MAARALLALAVLLSVAASVSAQGAKYTHEKYISILNGLYEVPAVKDTTGNGVSFLDIYFKNSLLFKARWTVAIQSLTDGDLLRDTTASPPRLTGVTAMHIHNGTFGTSGPIIFFFNGSTNTPPFLRTLPTGQALYGFSNANPSMLPPLNFVEKNSSRFYVNVHTSPNFGPGAVRGQLFPFRLIDPQAALKSPVGRSVKLIAVLKGIYETGNKDPTGHGVSVIDLALGANNKVIKAVWTVTIRDLTGGDTLRPSSTAPGVSAMHIHTGAFGVSGGIVFFFNGTTNTPPFIRTLPNGYSLYGFSNTNPSMLSALDAVRANPNAYYANVHSTAYPAGAVRGQLFTFDSVDPAKVVPNP